MMLIPIFHCSSWPISCVKLKSITNPAGEVVTLLRRVSVENQISVLREMHLPRFRKKVRGSYGYTVLDGSVFQVYIDLGDELEKGNLIRRIRETNLFLNSQDLVNRLIRYRRAGISNSQINHAVTAAYLSNEPDQLPVVEWTLSKDHPTVVAIPPTAVLSDAALDYSLDDLWEDLGEVPSDVLAEL